MPTMNDKFSAIMVYGCMIVFFRGARRDGHAGAFFSSGIARVAGSEDIRTRENVFFFPSFPSSFLSYVEHDEHGDDIPFCSVALS